MIDEFAKEYLHSDLREARAAMLWKLEGLSEYDARRPLTYTDTNLLGLVKHLSLTEIIDRYRQVWAHSDATIAALDIDATGHVPWWPRPDVQLFNVLVHVLTETSRHAGHADILREQLDGAVGFDPENMAPQERSAAYWADRCARIEHAARVATGDD